MNRTEAFNASPTEEAGLRNNALTIDVAPVSARTQLSVSEVRDRFRVEEYVARLALDRQSRLGGNIRSAVEEVERSVRRRI